MKSWVSEDTSMENVVSDTVVGQMSEGGNDTATTSRAGAGSPVRRTRGLAKGWVVSFAVVGLVILLWMNLKYFLSERKTPRPETPRKGQVWSERLSRVASEWVWH